RWEAAPDPADPAQMPRPARAADGRPLRRQRHRLRRAHPRPPARRTPRRAARLRRLRPASDPPPDFRGRDVYTTARPRIPPAPPGSAPMSDLSVAPVTVKFPHRSRRGILLGLSLPQLV